MVLYSTDTILYYIVLYSYCSVYQKDTNLADRNVWVMLTGHHLGMGQHDQMARTSWFHYESSNAKVLMTIIGWFKLYHYFQWLLLDDTLHVSLWLLLMTLEWDESVQIWRETNFYNMMNFLWESQYKNIYLLCGDE